MELSPIAEGLISPFSLASCLSRLPSILGFNDCIRGTTEWCAISDEDIEEAKRLIKSDEGNTRFDNSMHRSFLGKETVNEFAGFLLSKRWRINL